MLLGGREPAELGLGCTVDIDTRTGVARASITVPTPPGRHGVAPRLTLHYTSSAGNSEIGAGWSLGFAASIGIYASKHLPRFDETDRFQIGGSELVPWKEHGQLRRRVEGDWRITYHRVRRGSTQLRVEEWLHVPTMRRHFRSRDARNALTIYGARPDAAARIEDPSDPARTFAWLPELQVDPHGNAVWFEYAAENDDGVDRGSPFEPTNTPQSQRYLKRIRYGNVDPIAVDDAVLAGHLPMTRWCFAVVLDYGDHGPAPTIDPDRPWAARLDPFGSRRAGFAVRTRRLCRRIHAFHDFPELGPEPVRVGTLTFTHEEHAAGTVVREISYTGYRADAPARALPPLVFSYAPPVTLDSFEQLGPGALENVPAGLCSRAASLVDLVGDGMCGILTETDRAWYYKPNLGGGEFASQTVVLAKPSTRPNEFGLGDWDGDGNTDLARLGGRLAGMFSFDRDTETWGQFEPFTVLPHIEAFGGRAHWADLNGDGRLDVVIPTSSGLTWYPSLPDGGFDAPRNLIGPTRGEPLPSVGANRQLDLFFIDMTGDGLVDVVRIQNGCAMYWPSLGNGRFGEVVVMDDAPFIDGDLDAARVRFADLDGSGTTDLVYLGQGEIRTWINAAGNRFEPGPTLRGLPYMDATSDVSIRDLLGDGRPCLVWSSALPGRASPLWYMPLSEPVRARALLAVDNAQGCITTIGYSSSTTHYLRDAAAGQPWATKLPRPHLVADVREVTDTITGGRSTTRIEYHDGYFDSHEREFRGFARVDTYDTRLADAVTQPDDPASAAFAPPSVTRRWFHTGGEMWQRLAHAYTDGVVPMLPPHALDADAASADLLLDGLASLAGQPLRREVWAVGGTVPFEVEQSSPRLRCVELGSSTDDSVWSVIPGETLTAVYEQEAGDPRVAHQIVTASDAWDIATQTATVAYARRASPEVASQARTTVDLGIQSFISFDVDDRFELAIPLEARRLELAGVASGSAVVTRDRLLAADVTVAIASPGSFAIDLPPAPGAPAARLVAQTRNMYWDDARGGALPFGQVGTLTLVHHEEHACFDDQLISVALAGRVDAAKLEELSYFQRDGLWWAASPRIEYTPAAQFSQRVASVRSDGSIVRSDLDTYALCVKTSSDAFGNKLVAEIDYHVLAASRFTDPNGTISEVRRDALGVVVARSVHGTVDGQAWGMDPLSLVPDLTSTTLTSLLAAPSVALGGAQSVTYYDLTATPLVAVTLTRDQLVYDGTAAAPPPPDVHISVAYFDGFHRLLQVKTLVEPGPAIQRDTSGAVITDAGGHAVLAHADERWLSSGHTIYDVKQQRGRVYEAYFTTSPRYESDKELQQFGASVLYLHDALSRPTSVQLPNGTYTTTRYGAWSTEQADANDNVATSTYRALREGLPLTDPERQALEQTTPHAGTVERSLVDPRGNIIATVAQGGTTAADRRIESSYDITGRVRSVVDPRGLVTAVYTYDMRGASLHTHSVDAGDAWGLTDAHGRASLAWSPRGHTIVTTFDLADRPVSVDVTGEGLDHRVQTWAYGESLAQTEAVARNAFGRAIATRSGSGTLAIDRYDPVGNILATSQQLIANPDQIPNWNTTVELSGETFAETNVFDGLSRPRRNTLPDGTLREIKYLRSGGTDQVRVTTPLGEVVVFAGASYDARGQLESCTLGNGVAFEQTHDPVTCRLANQRAVRGATVYQDLTYTYDPVGNITQISDAAQTGPSAVVRGSSAVPVRTFTYDAHYRLTRETGRIHQALLQHDYVPFADGTVKSTRHISLANGSAIEACTRLYTYDASNNLTQARHIGPSQSWTTDMWISPTSNRSLPALDDNGIAITDPETRFDAAGNTIALSHLRAIEWSWCGTLASAVTIERPGGTNDSEVYVYSGDRQRVMKRATRVVQGGQLEITEKVYLGELERKRILRGETLILERWTVRVGGAPGAEIHRWTRDDQGRETDDVTRQRVHYRLGTHQGSATLELDETGNVLSYEEYFAYGGSAFIAGDDLRSIDRKDYRYCSKECDDATGLYAYGYRYYAPWMCRWLSTDPAGHADDLNLYQFVRGNPVCHVDPDGAQTSGTLTSITAKPGDVNAAIKQFNNGYGLDHGRMVTAAHWDPDWDNGPGRQKGGFIIDSEIRLSSEQVKAKLLQQFDIAWMSALTNHAGGSGPEAADESTKIVEGAHGDGTADLSGDVEKTGVAKPGLDETNVEGNPNGPDGMGVGGVGPGGGKIGKGANASGSTPGSSGGGGNIDGFGNGVAAHTPGEKFTPGGNGGKNASDELSGKGTQGGTGNAAQAGRPGGKPGGKKGGKDKENKPGKPKGDPNGTTPAATGAPSSALPPGPHVGAGGNANLAQGASTGSGTYSQAGVDRPNPKPGTGSSKRSNPDAPVGSSQGGGQNPRPHSGGDPSGRPGGHPDGWPDQRFEGTPQGSFWGVPGCGGTYVPPHWLSPWLQAATLLPEIVGGTLEVAAGVLMLAAPEPAITKAAGLVLIAHGLDSLTSTMTGNRTWFSRGGAWMATKAGADPDEAQWFGQLFDMVIPMAAGGIGGIASERAAMNSMNSSIYAAAEATDLSAPARMAPAIHDPVITVTEEAVSDEWIRDTARAEIGGDGDLPGRAQELKDGLKQKVGKGERYTTIGIGAAPADVSGGYEVRVAPSNPRKGVAKVLGELKQPGEVQLPGIKKVPNSTAHHGEQVVIASGDVFGVGATKPVCPHCAGVAGKAGVHIYTKLKPVKVPAKPRVRVKGIRIKKP